jgi:DNA polymerase I-like protein with 3'-5' exonuclease and polymerase domains
MKNANTPTAREMKEKVSQFFRKRGDIERMSLNYPIQGESAEITKLACVYFWTKYLVPNNLLFKVLIVNIIHDEILIETPEEIAQQAAAQLEKAMVDAGAKFCKRVPLKADPCIEKFWKK